MHRTTAKRLSHNMLGLYLKSKWTEWPTVALTFRVSDGHNNKWYILRMQANAIENFVRFPTLLSQRNLHEASYYSQKRLFQKRNRLAPIIYSHCREGQIHFDLVFRWVQYAQLSINESMYCQSTKELPDSQQTYAASCGHTAGILTIKHGWTWKASKIPQWAIFGQSKHGMLVYQLRPFSAKWRRLKYLRALYKMRGTFGFRPCKKQATNLQDSQFPVLSCS